MTGVLISRDQDTNQHRRNTCEHETEAGCTPSTGASGETRPASPLSSDIQPSDCEVMISNVLSPQLVVLGCDSPSKPVRASYI